MTPLIAASRRLTDSTLTTEAVSAIASDWVSGTEWKIATVQVRDGDVVVRAVGPLPSPPPAKLRRLLDRRGEHGTDVALELIPEVHVDLPAR